MPAGIIAHHLAAERGTALMRAPLRPLPLRPVWRTASTRTAAYGRSDPSTVLEPIPAATSYNWAVARRVMNRLAHLLLTGNINAGWWRRPWPQSRTCCRRSARRPRGPVAGTAATITVLVLSAAVMWYVTRAVLNRLAHALTGNTMPCQLVQLVDGEATFQVVSMHGTACGCRAFLQAGVRGHCDAAIRGAELAAGAVSA